MVFAGSHAHQDQGPPLHQHRPIHGQNSGPDEALHEKGVDEHGRFASSCIPQLIQPKTFSAVPSQ